MIKYFIDKTIADVNLGTNSFDKSAERLIKGKINSIAMRIMIRIRSGVLDSVQNWILFLTE